MSLSSLSVYTSGGILRAEVFARGNLLSSTTTPSLTNSGKRAAVDDEVNTKLLTESCFAAALRVFRVPAITLGTTASTSEPKDKMLAYIARRSVSISPAQTASPQGVIPYGSHQTCPRWLYRNPLHLSNPTQQRPQIFHRHICPQNSQSVMAPLHETLLSRVRCNPLGVRYQQCVMRCSRSHR